MALRYDAKTGQMQEIAQEAIDAETLSAAIPRDALESPEPAVRMIDPDGKPVFVGKHELLPAVEQGYKYESNIDYQARKEAEFYDTPIQAAILGAGRSVSLGLTDAAFRGIDAALGTDISAKVEKTKEYNPVASTVGDVGGMVVSLLGGPLKTIGNLGKNTAAKILAKEGVEQTAKSGIKKFIVEKGVEGVITGAAIGAGQGLSEKALNTKEDFSENLVKHIGVNALLGGAIGGLGDIALGGIGEGVKKGFGWGRKVFKADEASLKGILDLDNEVLDKEAKDYITELVGGQNLSIDLDVVKAGQRLGMDLTPGTMSTSDFVKKLESSLAQSNTMATSGVRGEVNQMYSQANDLVDAMFADKSGKVKYELGEFIKERIGSQFKAKYAPIKDLYNELKSYAGDIEVGSTSLARASRLIDEDIAKGVIQHSSSAKSIKQVSSRLAEGKLTVENLKELASTVRSLRAPIMVPAEINLINTTIRRIDRLYENSITRAALDAASDKQLAKYVSSDLIAKSRLARKEYRKFISELEEFSSTSGIKRGKVTATAFQSSLDDIPSERMVDLLWKKENRAWMNKLAEFDPKLVRELSLFEKAQIAKKIEDTHGKLSLKRLVTATKNLDDDYAKMVFGDEGLTKLKDLKTVSRALPDKVGPSGTPEGFRWILGPLNPITNALDMVNVGLYRAAGSMSKSMQALEKQETAEIIAALKASALKKKAVVKAIEKVGEGTKKLVRTGILSSIKLNEEDGFDDEITQLDEMAANIKVMDPKKYAALSTLDSQTADMVQGKLLTAVTLLRNAAPTREMYGVLDKKRQRFNPAKVQDFYRVAKTIDDPKTILEDVSRGTVTNKQVEVLRELYPNYLKKIASIVASEELEIPYAKKISLNKLLNNQGMYTLKPNVIRGIQGAIYKSGMEEQKKINAQKLQPNNKPTRVEELSEK